MKFPNAGMEHLIALSPTTPHNGQLASLVMQECEDRSTSPTFQHRHLEQMIGEAETAILDIHPNLK